MLWGVLAIVQDMREITKQADVLVVAIGKPKFVDESYIKEGTVVIDVGIQRNAETYYKLLSQFSIKVLSYSCALTLGCLLLSHTMNCFMRSSIAFAHTSRFSSTRCIMGT